MIRNPGGAHMAQSQERRVNTLFDPGTNSEQSPDGLELLDPDRKPYYSDQRGDAQAVDTTSQLQLPADSRAAQHSHE